MIDLISHITQVTVFQDRAQVTRQATIDLTVGEYALYFDMLPASIEEKSIQVSGENLPVILQQVKFLKEYYEESPDEVVLTLEEEKQQLLDAKRQNEALQKRLRGQQQFLQKMVNRVTRPVKGQKKAKTQDWFKMLGFYQQQQIELDDKLHAAILQAKQLARRFHKADIALQKFQGQYHKTKRKVVIRLQVQQAGTLTLNLTYMVRGAIWEPYYDFRVFTETDKMEMIYQAIVYQNTEESWENVALKLSTARPHISGSQPELQPLRIMANTPPPEPLPPPQYDSPAASPKMYSKGLGGGGILSRVSDIIKANAYDAFEKSEDPAKMIKNMRLELQENISIATSELARYTSQEQQMKQTYKRSASTAKNWESKAQLALDAGNETLARQALAKMRDTQEQAQQYKTQYDQAVEDTAKLRRQVTTLKERLQEIKMKESTLFARSQASKSSVNRAHQTSSFDHESTFAKFDKFEERILKAEAEEQAFRELGDEFGMLEEQSSVDDDLARLRQKLNASSSSTPTPKPPPKKAKPRSYPPTQETLAPFDLELARLQQTQKKGQTKNQHTKVKRSSSKIASGGTAVFFEIAGQHTIQNDDTDHQITVLKQDFAVQLQYSSVPKLSPYTYLRARATNHTEYPLLAGSTNVFLDNNFVANSSIDTIAPTESFWTFLGIDEGVRVERKFVKKHEKKEGNLLSKKHRNLVYEYNIEAQSFKSKTIELVIKDQLPITQNDKVKVVLQAPVYEEDTTQLKINKLKYLEWSYQLGASQSLKIPFIFSITFPNDVWLSGMD